MDVELIRFGSCLKKHSLKDMKEVYEEFKGLYKIVRGIVDDVRSMSCEPAEHKPFCDLIVSLTVDQQTWDFIAAKWNSRSRSTSSRQALWPW